MGYRDRRQVIFIQSPPFFISEGVLAINENARYAMPTSDLAQLPVDATGVKRHISYHGRPHLTWINQIQIVHSPEDYSIAVMDAIITGSDQQELRRDLHSHVIFEHLNETKRSLTFIGVVTTSQMEATYGNAFALKAFDYLA